MGSTRLRRGLARLKEAALPVVLAPADGPARGEEVGVLAGELAAAFGRTLEAYREHLELTPEEARARAEEHAPTVLKRALSAPPDQVSWCDLYAISREDPEKGLARWEEVKEEARQEVRYGHRAARALEGGESNAWGRAQFLAFRAELTEAWRPRNALEQQLIDQLAQWQTLLLSWQERLALWGMLWAGVDKRRRKEDFEAPRVAQAEALEQATRMVERCHRLYLQTLRALRDLRRQGPPVVVRRARQVNIGQQQVNVVEH